MRFHAKLSVDGQLLGEGEGKSQRTAQSKAAWAALVALGEIHLDCYVCLTNKAIRKHKLCNHYVCS